MRLFKDPVRAPEIRSLYGEILRLAWPVFVGNSYIAVIAFLCRVIVSDLQEQAYNAINIGLMFFVLITTVLMTMGVGTISQVAQRWGAGEKQKAEKVMRQSIAFGFLVSILMVLVSIPAAFLFFRFMGVDAETEKIGGQFVFWILLVIPLVSPGIFLASALVGAGDTKTPMLAGGLMGLCCLLLAYGLILGKLGLPRLETLGASLCIAISLLVFTAFISVMVLLGKTRLKLARGGWKLDWKIGIEIFRIGIPAAIERILIQLGILIFLRVLNLYGDSVTAGFFTGFAVFTLARAPLLGLQTAATTLVGQKKGSGRLDLAESVFRHCALLGFGLMAVLGAVIYFVATPSVFSVFFSELGAETIAHARTYTVILIFTLPLIGVAFVFAGGLRGSGHAGSPLIASIIGVFAGRLLLAYLLYWLLHPPVYIVMGVMLIDFSLRIISMSFPLRSGKWKT
jgi:putative MATE family efflux protein